MDRKLLGQRLKEARLVKQLTQAEVSGDFITRNMLSQIENGLAIPSMSTLAYLSDILEIPMSSLVSKDDSPYPVYENSDFVIAKNHLNQGKDKMDKGDMDQAGKDFEKAREHALLAIHAASSIHAESILLIENMVQKLKKN